MGEGVLGFYGGEFGRRGLGGTREFLCHSLSRSFGLCYFEDAVLRVFSVLMERCGGCVVCWYRNREVNFRDELL